MYFKNKYITLKKYVTRVLIEGTINYLKIPSVIKYWDIHNHFERSSHSLRWPLVLRNILSKTLIIFT
jgi:hypothetical protein